MGDFWEGRRPLSLYYNIPVASSRLPEPMPIRHFPQSRVRRLPLFIALSLALPSVALADDQAGNPDSHATVDLNAVEVHASPLRRTAEDLAQPVEILAGEKLDDAKANSLGETVGRLPGVQSSYFGPGVGRPIVRGFDGARVQVLSDGLGSGDVSTVSVDHAVSIEPFLADQIEVLKGPATLLYGSGAIGGAVNVIDGRIPERMQVGVRGAAGVLRSEAEGVDLRCGVGRVGVGVRRGCQAERVG